MARSLKGNSGLEKVVFCSFKSFIEREFLRMDNWSICWQILSHYND